MKVETALNEMGLDIADEFRNARVVRAVDVQRELNGLYVLVETLQQKIEKTTCPKPAVDVSAVFTKWQSNQFDFSTLDGREQRALCIDPKFAVHSEVVRAVAKHRGVFKRSSTLFGFVNAYFASWRTFQSPEQMEKLIQELVREKCSLNKSRVLAKWNSSPFLFGANADKHLGRMVVQERSSIAQVCANHFFGETTNFARRTTDAAISIATHVLVNKPAATLEATVLKEITWIKENLLSSSTEAAIYRTCIGQLILSEFAERYAGVKQLLTGFVVNDSRLGDPRQRANESNWRTMPEGTRERLLSWFAKENIEFFFNAIVPRNDENRRRAEFWLKYAKRPGNIKDFQAAISLDDDHKVRRRAREIGQYSRLTGAKTSAFMMLFVGSHGREYVVIEFSETGNAAYIFERSMFERHGDTLRSQEFERRLLRRQEDVTARIIHNGDWERNASYTLYELGIRP